MSFWASQTLINKWNDTPSDQISLTIKLSFIFPYHKLHLKQIQSFQQLAKTMVFAGLVSCEHLILNAPFSSINHRFNGSHFRARRSARKHVLRWSPLAKPALFVALGNNGSMTEPVTADILSNYLHQLFFFEGARTSHFIPCFSNLCAIMWMGS